ncbi:deleted in malignant brain tumors 1 protein-like [Saccostrea cucullata]|uniref:deleted in malignant brain tumors 1 protein-like n=1 Tax=Saccostrea cuccullata TaxID=36930 RepID=UPI002ED29663
MDKCSRFQVIDVTIIFYLAISFQTVSSQCSTPLQLSAHHGTAPTISSPNYPYNYPSSINCQWSIQAETSSSTVGVVFNVINTESFFDKIRIYDGNSPSGTLLVTLFGSKTNDYYESTGEYMYIVFTSDMGIEKAGFTLQYFSLYPTIFGQRQLLPCYSQSAQHTITVTTTLSLQQSLATFPDFYSGNDFCYWKIDAGTGNYLNISVLLTDDAYGSDPGGLTIYDGNSNAASVLGTISDKSQTESGSVVLGTSQQYAFFVYYRRSVNLYRGFLLSFNRVGTPPAPVTVPTIGPPVVDTCGNTSLIADSVENHITSPNYPMDYNSGSSCVWIIRVANESLIIKLTFEAIDLESCCDFLYIYDGDTTYYALLGTVTGNYYNSTGLPVYLTTGTAVRLHFVSDERTQQTGFKIRFQAVISEIPSCVNQSVTTVLTASYQVQTFESHPEFSIPQNYNNSQDIFWLITKPSESDILSVQFLSFGLEHSENCVFDNVTIYKGACLSNPLVKTLCGDLVGNSTSYTYSTGKFLLMRFKTDASVTDKGFSVSYVIVNSTSSDNESSSGLPDYVRYTIAGVITSALLIAAICFCVCCCRKLCPKTASLRMAAKSEMKRNLILVNTNKPKRIKMPMKNKRKSKYGDNKVSAEPPKFPLAGPGINPVAPPFPLDLKDVKTGEKSTDVPNRLPPRKEKKIKEPKPKSLSDAEKDKNDSHGNDSVASFDPNAPIDFSTIPHPFDYKDPWQLAKD